MRLSFLSSRKIARRFVNDPALKKYFLLCVLGLHDLTEARKFNFVAVCNDDFYRFAGTELRKGSQLFARNFGEYF